jgi:hypothetical protein
MTGFGTERLVHVQSRLAEKEASLTESEMRVSTMLSQQAAFDAEREKHMAIVAAVRDCELGLCRLWQ